MVQITETSQRSTSYR